MTVAVVLGMHGSGTSAVAEILREMGVDMGTTFMGPVRDMPTWEDVCFVRLNAHMLTLAGGDWGNLPAEARIAEAAERLRPEMELLVVLREADNEGRAWGWKDPRNCATVCAWHPLLAEPRYVVVTRDYADIARSILARGPSAKDKERWIGGAVEHYERAEAFLTRTGAPSYKVAFEDLVSRARADQVLEGLVRFLDLPGFEWAVEEGLKVIRFRAEAQ